MQYVLFYQLQWSWPVRQLGIERIGQTALYQHTLTFGQRSIHVANVLEYVLSDQLLFVRPLLDLGLQQITHLGTLQFLSLFMEGWRAFQTYDTSKRHRY